MAAIKPIMKRFSFLIVSNAFFSVDTFFFLSGFLTLFSFMRLIEQQDGKLNVFFILKFYLHRFWVKQAKKNTLNKKLKFYFSFSA